MEKNIKEEFISTLSHEIRTPLTSVKGFCETLLNSYDKIDDEKKKEFLNIILNQSKRLINLVENVLSVAKLDCGNSNIILSKINAVDILNTSLKITKINYKDFNFNITKPKNNLYILSDNDKTQQIFLNILDNACKYSKNSNNIDIKIFLTQKDKEDYVAYSIKNYGSYIKKEDETKIFEKFTRLESYITSATQGSGLGLYIVKNLIEQLKGSITFNSNYEELSTEFIVYFPIYEIEKATKGKI